MARPDTGSKKKLRQQLKDPRFAAGLLWCGATALIITLCITVMTPERYNLHVGDIAKKTITASKDVVDEQITHQRKEAAAAQVRAVSYKDETIAGEVMNDVQTACDEVRAVHRFGEEIHAEQNAAPDAVIVYRDEDMTKATELIPTVPMTHEQIRTVFAMTQAEVDDLCQNLTASVRTTIATTILEGEVPDAITNIQKLVYNMPPNQWWNVAQPILRACLRPNMIIDQESTEANRQKARDEVEPTVYKPGENVVVAGERVTAPQLAVLNSLGMIQGTRYDTELYIGIVLLVSLLMAGLYVQLYLFVPDVIHSFRLQVLLLLILGLTLVLCVIIMQFVPQMLPVALAVLLCTILLGTRVAWSVNVTLALLLGLLVLKGSLSNSTQALAITLMAISGGLVGIMAVRKRVSRSKVLLSGAFVGVTNAMILFAAGLVLNNDIHSVLVSAGYGMLAGLLAPVLCVGIQPALEVLFNLVTPAKLLELSNPNHALLRRLMIEAPGTYHHSMVVANIAEAAAEAIGANPLLARVGAYYHDIGKLKRPGYFKENQTGENPHDHTDPRVSTAILVAHVRDGVALGQRHRLPQRVLDMIAQHHGDTPVLFFYHKAVQLCEGQPVDIKDFRYEGPRPQTAEAALLMLADTVEAAVRTIQDATPEKITETIRRLVKGKAEDGQLDVTPLTFRDIDRVCSAFDQVLNGVFHERIEYPTIEIHPVKELPKEVEAYMQEQQAVERLQKKTQQSQEASPAEATRAKPAEQQAAPEPSPAAPPTEVEG